MSEGSFTLCDKVRKGVCLSVSGKELGGDFVLRDPEPSFLITWLSQVVQMGPNF